MEKDLDIFGSLDYVGNLIIEICICFIGEVYELMEVRGFELSGIL